MTLLMAPKLARVTALDSSAGMLNALADHVKPGGRVALADLDTEDGGFHGDAGGVVHHGFARETFGHWLRQAGFADAQFSTAFTVRRESDDGTRHDYPIFLAIASKPGS